VARRGCGQPSVLVRAATVGCTAGGRYTTPSSAQSIRPLCSETMRVRKAVTARRSAQSSFGEGRIGGGAKAAATLSNSWSSSITRTLAALGEKV
jgi:hypothetical protein